MPAARHWRIVGIAARGDVALHTLQLFDGDTRRDAGATLTATHAPVAGALAALQDADAGSSCTFARAAATSAGFALVFDLGSALDVTSVRLGAVSAATWPDELALEYLTASGWARQVMLARLPYPGDGAAATFGQGATLNSQTFGESFNLSIPAGFATVLTDSATLDVSYDAAAQAATLTANGYNAAWMLAAPAAQQHLRVRLDIEFVSANNGNPVNAVGVALTGGASLTQHLFNHAGQLATVYRSNSASGLGLITQLAANAATLPSSGRHTYELTSVPSNTVGSRDYTMSVDGLQIAAHTLDVTAPAALLKAGIYVRSVTVKLHEVRLYGIGASGLLDRLIATTAARGQLAASAPVPAPALRVSRGQLGRDMEFGGAASITGTVGIKGTGGAPDTMTKSRVRLLRQRDGLLAREVWSDPVTGAFAFHEIDPAQQFIALAEDNAGVFAPVAADRRTPEVPT